MSQTVTIEGLRKLETTVNTLLKTLILPPYSLFNFEVIVHSVVNAYVVRTVVTLIFVVVTVVVGLKVVRGQQTGVLQELALQFSHVSHGATRFHMMFQYQCFSCCCRFLMTRTKIPIVVGFESSLICAVSLTWTLVIMAK